MFPSICHIKHFKVYNDRGSVNRTLENALFIDTGKLQPGKPLPQWPYGQPPLIRYFDGELLILDYQGQDFEIRSYERETELFSIPCPENIYVQEQDSICVDLEGYSKVPQPDLKEMFRHRSFNSIVLHGLDILDKDIKNEYPTHNDDGTYTYSLTALIFLQVFTITECIFLLNKLSILHLEESARLGNPYALFALGRYHLCTQNQPEACQLATDYFRKAYEKQLPEAAAALSRMYQTGDIGKVDRVLAKELLKEALRRQSPYAYTLHLKDLIFGLNDMTAEPDKALEIINELIEIDTFEHEYVNPQWYYLRGCARQETESLQAALPDFETSARMGKADAWAEVAFAKGFNQQNEKTDPQAYRETISTGTAQRDGFCTYLLALDKVENYDNMDSWQKRIHHNQLFFLLEKSFKLGCKEAAEALGDIYLNAWFDTGQDLELAWEWYTKGSRLASVNCFEKMHDMGRHHYVEVSQETTDQCALQGARLGSESMIAETVIAFSQGRLANYAEEIETYYVPVFDAMPEVDREQVLMQNSVEEDEDPDDYPDDDGRFDAYV